MRWAKIRGESSSIPQVELAVIFYFYLLHLLSQRCFQMFYYFTTLIEMPIKYLSLSLWFYLSIVSWKLNKLIFIKQTKKVTSNRLKLRQWQGRYKSEGVELMVIMPVLGVGWYPGNTMTRLVRPCQFLHHNFI